MNKPIQPTNDDLQRLRARSSFWELRLQEKCLQPWREAMLELGAQCSAIGSRHNTAVEFGAMQSALASLVANMVRGFAMTVAQGKPASAQQCIDMTLQEALAYIAQGAKDIAEGNLDEVELITLSHGKPVAFDFRDHLHPDNGSR